MKSNKTTIFLVSFFMLLGIGFIAYIFPQIKANQDKAPQLPIIGNDLNHHVSDFSFVNQDGKTITNADIKGKVVVVEYFFATCKGICPKMNENMEKVYKAFRGNKNVLLLSHTVDPMKDTVQALKAYSLRFDADPSQWMFLTGDKKQLYDMARYSYLISAEDDTAGVSVDEDFIHDEHFVLVDRHGRVRGFYEGTKQEGTNKLIGDINILLKEKDTPNP
ncbi:MAG: electron transport protein SCO1/SenC [Flavipsychrobacter sp.]|jgi:protein SCO1/2|nr:electron transport protein SCO1/SenC [Flavipsychrobacter sp.]